MTIKEYQTMAGTFGEYKHPIYTVLGLNEEVGELTGKIAKKIRKEGLEAWLGSSQEYMEAVRKEMGDVMWNVAEICNVMGLDLESIMVENIAKLQDRQKRNVICGEGDNR